jgi:hypothetical protein
VKYSDEILEISTNRRVNDDRSQLCRVLEAQFAYERMSNARSILAHLLAIVGVLVWLEAIWPDFLPQQARFFTLLSWGGILFLTLAVAVEEYILWRKLTSHLSRQGGATVRHD